MHVLTAKQKNTGISMQGLQTYSNGKLVEFWMVSGLERQISLRTTREDLIRRGLLKEVDENQQPSRKLLESTDDVHIPSKSMTFSS